MSSPTPDHWNTTTIGAVADVIPGFAFKSKDWCNEGISVIKIKNIVGDLTVNTAEADCVPCELMTDRLKKFVLRDGDMIIAMTGATAGKTGKLRCDQWMLLNQRVAKFVPKSMHPGFFWALISSKEYQERFFYLADGAAQPNMSGRQIENFEIPEPPVDTQRKIASILSAYDDLIENNTRRIAILEEMAQAIYREWFVHFRFPGHENVKLVDSPLGQIPEGWEACTIKDVCESTSYGFTASASQEEVGPKFLRITDIVPSTISWENVPFCEIEESKVAKYTLAEGDVVVARTGATTGYAKRLNKRHPLSVYASYLVRLRPTERVGKTFLGIIVESDDYKRFIKANLSGAAQPQANAQVLSSFRLAIPDETLIRDFDERVEPMLDVKELLEQKNRNLRSTRDLLLPRLISGKLDVEDLDIDVGLTTEALEEATA